MAAELFGVRVLGRVMGIVLTADGVAEATAPMLVGYLRDRTGSYDIGFLRAGRRGAGRRRRHRASSATRLQPAR